MKIKESGGLRKNILAFLLLFLAMPFSVVCQNLSIEGFELDKFDISARTSPVKDNNNVACALVKIISNDEVTGVQGNVVKSEEYGNEYWVYLSAGTKQIKILTRHHAPLDLRIDQFLNSGVESQSTYQLKLKSDLPPEVLFGTSNPLAPVTMAKDGDPRMPKWWVTREDGMYVGISLPTLDGETAKLSAITNAIYSFIHSQGCPIKYAANITMRNDYDETVAVISALKKGFSIKILQEYYNPEGEYFVLCDIADDPNAQNAMRLQWEFKDSKSDGGLNVYADVKARIKNAPFVNQMTYEVAWTPDANRHKVISNERLLADISQSDIRDQIDEMALAGAPGLSQLRLLASIPLLPGSVMFRTCSQISSEDSFFNSVAIESVGSSSPDKIKFYDFKDNILHFGLTEIFPEGGNMPNNDDLSDFMQKTGLSEKYARITMESTNNTFVGDGFIDQTESNLFERAKNKSFLYALAGGLIQLCSEIHSGSESEVAAELSGNKDSLPGVELSALFYLDPDERVACKEKKYQKQWLSAKSRYPKQASVVFNVKSFINGNANK